MKPKREPARNNEQTYFVSFQTAQRAPLFRHERWLLVLLNILDRHASEFSLHDYVVMEDYVHLLITPADSVERVAQLVKGGFSYQAKRQFEWKAEIWQQGFTDHRIQDHPDYQEHLAYVGHTLQGLRESLRTQRGRSGVSSELLLAAIPTRLKPLEQGVNDGPAEAMPLQSKAPDDSRSVQRTTDSATHARFTIHSATPRPFQSTAAESRGEIYL